MTCLFPGVGRWSLVDSRWSIVVRAYYWMLNLGRAVLLGRGLLRVRLGRNISDAAHRRRGEPRLYRKLYFLQRACRGHDYDFFYRRVLGQEQRIDYRSGNGLSGHHFVPGGFWPERVPDRRIGSAGHEGDHANSLRSQLLAQGVGESQGAMLRCVVGGRTGEDKSEM